MHTIDGAPNGLSGALNPLSRWWHGRLGWRFGAELARMLGLFVVYKFVRMLSQDEVGSAFHNARRVVHIEQVTGLFTEQRLQEVVLRSEFLVRFLNAYYFVAHLAITVTVLFFLYVGAQGRCCSSCCAGL